MFVKDQMTKRINHSKEFFAKQYGHDELEKIRIETMNSYDTMKYFVTLDNQYFPNANDIMETAIKVDYVKNQPFVSFEKKIDYMHISSVLMLENWLHNILPKQNDNPTSIAKSLGTQETGWMIAEGIMTDLFAKCDELEKEFKNN